MKKYIGLLLASTMILGMSTNAFATRMRQQEKQQENTETSTQSGKDWGSINYVENLPGPDFSGYTYGGVPVDVPNYNSYSEFTAADITNFSDAIVDMKGWDALIGSIQYDLGENSGNSSAGTEAEIIALKPGVSKAYKDGSAVAIDSADEEVTPVIENNRVMLPLRFLSESIGATVSWDEETRTAKISKHGKVVSVVPGFAEYTIDGKTYPMDTAAKLQNGRILVPVRMVSEALGKKVLWKDETVWVSGYEYELTDEIKAQASELLR